ncbi:TonB-dependent receptor [Cesiribacter sp. SM1]|uniref:TonB-dependent receptor n=1 Tax=Cesiribacter sp. SM1 TaxID=2861196 RepID=UPI001CD6CF2C|nr:TonB-dependent receptor [Cesiribacter sp. SM1]
MSTIPVFAQQAKHTISGTVKDKSTGETLIGVTIRVQEMPSTGTITNEYGYYSLTLPEGAYTILFNYLGYQTKSHALTLKAGTKIDVALEEDAQELNEVVVTATRPDDNVKNPLPGVQKLDMAEINKVPVLMGERDVLKTMQLIPGIKSAGEGNAGFYVRGGGADQNLILLDDALVYNASHLLGFFSTFNSDAIKDVTIYKGGMPAEYGGRLSSVLDITMNEGNNQEYHVNGGIGIISAKLNVEGPIQKGKSSFLLSGRRTYADVFLKLSNDENISNSSLYFYDLNAKANYTFSDKDRLFVSGYFGRDKLGFRDMFAIDWGNATATLRWNHLLNARLFSNTSVIFSDYSYRIDVDFNDNEIGITSRIRDWNLKQEFQYFPNPQNTLKFGIQSTYHTVVPGEISYSGPQAFTLPPLQERYSWENGLYFTNNWNASDRLELVYGARLSSFSVLGAGDFYSLNEQHRVVDTTSYGAGEFVKTYVNLEPRLSAAWQLNDKSSVKASYARTTQNMHLLSNSTTSNPTDKWVPSSNTIKPQIGDQVSAGYFRNFANNKYEFSTEAYYKYMQNQIDYKDGADITNSDVVETELLFGKGRAYGIEFFLKKRYGRFNGWIGYTLSRTERLIEGINESSWYPARQDRTHDLSLVGIYELSPKWTLSASWVYNTGNAVTFPSGKYRINEQVVFYYTERNGYRLPDYHRLDVGATLQLKKTERFSSELVFSIYNAYGRENPFIINFRENENNPSMTEAYQVALFKLVPSVSYNFRF